MMTSARVYPAVACAIAALLGAASAARAETVILNGSNVDKVAAIADVAPRMSWALWEYATGRFNNGGIGVSPGRSVLMRYSLASIPAGQRITHAEWIIPVLTTEGVEPRFYFWRVLGDWGPGVSHLYRSVFPQRVEWTRPGARGQSSDRATRPSEIVRVESLGDRVVNVTEDIEIWYTKSSPNNGWIITIEDPAVSVRFNGTPMTSPDNWKLRVTYEPE
ncbi:MAG: hypothetical protein K8S99_17500 [Planctomycetes bacterium]|nr:hypothetical protein [Planctomycetota bacterium]